MWAIGIKFVTGNCVASDIADREAAEWPPHPLRLYMALAATFFETCGDEDQRQALLWLESLPAPDILASDAQPRGVVTTFVPVNDGRGAESMPRVRSRQPRTFPTIIPDCDTIYYAWTTPLPPERQGPLVSILKNVSRLGHSSSLVWAWLELGFDPSNCRGVTTWQADADNVQGRPLRRMFPGALGQLEASYNRENIERHVELTEQIRVAKGKAKKELQATWKREFGDAAPVSQRSEMRLGARYRQLTPAANAQTDGSLFDDDLLILTQFEGPVLGSESTLRVAKAMRGAILSQFSREADIPEWISGHSADGSPSTRPHLAIAPLPFVGAPYADGHLLGLALVFPREVAPRDRAMGLARLLTDDRTGNDKPIELRLGSLGTVTLQIERRAAPPRALQPQTWTQASRYWTTVTPLVLDRFPKTNRTDDRSGWLREVAETVDLAWQRTRISGAVRPAEIAVNHNAWLPGVPRSKPGGGGFPAYQLKGGAAGRYMVHALLAFERPVAGPVLLGAGRFLGYGVCKPFYPHVNRDA